MIAPVFIPREFGPVEPYVQPPELTRTQAAQAAFSILNPRLGSAFREQAPVLDVLRLANFIATGEDLLKGDD